MIPDDQTSQNKTRVQQLYLQPVIDIVASPAQRTGRSGRADAVEHDSKDGEQSGSSLVIVAAVLVHVVFVFLSRGECRGVAGAQGAHALAADFEDVGE